MMTAMVSKQRHFMMMKTRSVKTGFNRLDKKIKGLRGSDLMLLAARPSMGKTALALSMITNIVLSKRPRSVLFFSLEMNRHALMQRFIASEAKVSLKDIRSGFFNRDRWQDLVGAAARFSEAPLFINDNPGMRMAKIRAISCQLIARLQKDNQKLGMIVIDYVQLVRGTSRHENRREQIAEISRGLKRLACDLNVPVIVLSQVGQSVEAKGRADARPQISDLLESIPLGQDADVVAFIYREEYYHPQKPNLKGRAEIIVAKNPRGGTGPVKIRFEREYAKFSNS